MSAPLVGAVSGTAMLIALVVVLVLAGLAVFLAFRAVVERRTSSLSGRLESYAPDERAASEGRLHRKEETRLTDTHFLQEAADITGRVAERYGLLTRVENMLEQADLPIRASEVLFLYVAGLLFVAVGGLLVAGDLLTVLILVAVLAVVPVMVLRHRRKKRLRNFQTQLPDLLHLIGGALRAGFSFMQALETVAREVSEPARKELSRVVSETHLGRPPEEALEEVATRMDSVDLGWAVMAVRIQREVGGNLAEVLETVADTMVQRERLRREVLTLTAEGRFSAIVLGLFPPLFGLFLFLIQRDYMTALVEETGGQIALGGAALLATFGFIWLRRVMAIEV